MIQRIQSVYLAIAFIITAVCLCLPIGVLSPEKTMGTDITMFNLWKLQDNTMTFGVWPMFALLFLSCIISLYAIFSYKNRKRQVKLCNTCILLVLAWVVAYALFGFVLPDKEMTFSPLFAAFMPFVALILYLLARRGIIRDEKLVRAADRIR
ncbi:MAG: DUF4293 domain-containing protein [Prevotella sp.]|nr:DUF4293 domain-containing protein [Prevotella sp.]